MYSNIPPVMRGYRQWIVWRLEDRGGPKPTKVPYSAATGRLASVTAPDTWSTFDEACAAMSGDYAGIGFVFTKNDPFFGIDLDDAEGDAQAYERQLKIYQTFDTYAELSPSGKGLHIIGEGSVERGRRRSKIEVYSSERFFTMTGNVYRNAPVRAYQEYLDILFNELGNGAAIYTYEGDSPQREDDAAIITKAQAAYNGDKFTKLLVGDWESLYSSQSEADFAFVDIIAFYTQNREQITRMFRGSPLGRRDKAWRDDYVKYMVDKSFDRMTPPVDLDGLRIAVEKSLALMHVETVPVYDMGAGATPVAAAAPIPNASPIGATAGHTVSDAGNVATSVPYDDEPYVAKALRVAKPEIPFPPGLIGEVAEFFYAASPRPVRTIALGAAIGLIAGITGKAYNVSNTGLNQYIMVIAGTGRGKEAMASGIDKLMIAVRDSGVPSAQEFLGPGTIASAPALIKYLSKTSSCFISVTGEVSGMISEMSGERAPAHLKMLKLLLLDLFNKSGNTQSFKPMIYADSDKNTTDIHAPSFTWLGESTPARFYAALDESLIADGFVPRWTILEYDGPRVGMNEQHGSVKPTFQLVDKMATLVSTCQGIMAKRQALAVMATPEAANMIRDFDKLADDKINNTISNTTVELWNRAHVKLLKMSALVAVGCNPFQPQITVEIVEWAKMVVLGDINALLRKFEAGMVGKNSEEARQLEEMTRIIGEYMTVSPHEIAAKYNVHTKLITARVVPYAYINRRLSAVSAFRLDRLGATAALKRTIQILIDSDYLREVGGTQRQELGTSAKCYVVSTPAAFGLPAV